jgi:hypothetical protein
MPGSDGAAAAAASASAITAVNAKHDQQRQQQQHDQVQGQQHLTVMTLRMRVQTLRLQASRGLSPAPALTNRLRS